MDNLEEEFIVDLCKQVAGIGSVTAGHIASDFESCLDAFLDADKPRLLSIKKTNGKVLLKDEQASAIVGLTNDIPKGRPCTELWLMAIFKVFLLDQVTALASLTLDTLDINPFLAKALDFRTPRDVLEFNLYQAITRSIVTSWGMTVEKIFTKIGASPYTGNHAGVKKGNRPDIQIKKKGMTSYIQLKSGPNTMNIGMIQSLNDVIEVIEGQEPRNKVLLGMTYGTRDMVSSQIRGTLRDFKDRSLIGRELWDFVSDTKNYHNKLFSLLDEASEGIMEKSYIVLIGEKIDQLEQQWKDKYGYLKLDEALDNYV